MDEAVKSFGKASAVKITAANSYILAFHVESRWHRYNAYATLRVTTSLSECMSGGIFHHSARWMAGFEVFRVKASDIEGNSYRNEDCIEIMLL
jgi:hypothetical protein